MVEIRRETAERVDLGVGKFVADRSVREIVVVSSSDATKVRREMRQGSVPGAQHEACIEGFEGGHGGVVLRPKRPRGHSGSVWILCVGRCSLDIDYETAPGGTASLLVAGARPRKLCRRPCEPRRYHVSSWTRGATTLIGVRRRRQCLSLHVEVLAGSPRCLARANDVSEASASNFHLLESPVTGGMGDRTILSGARIRKITYF